LVSKKTEINIIGIVSVAGLIVALIMALVVFGPFFGFELSWFKIDQNYAIVIMAIGISAFAIGIGNLQREGLKLTKEMIADFANPILNSKGKVSAIEIADNPLKKKIAIDILVKTYLTPMITEGYFQGAHLENGWLIKDTMPCEYCSKPIKTTETKCPNCGAAVKK
jgi:hypothetical protein